MTLLSLTERKAEVDRRIAEACARSGRSPEEVNVIAVTKYVSLDRTREALDSGCVHLGENRWQDAKDKWEAFPEGSCGAGEAPVWHFIGSLQTNKVKDVIGKFTYIHSLDRLSLADAIDKKARSLGIVVPCFIQVNVSAEQSKHGIAPEQLRDLASGLAAYPGVKPVGLMTMAPHDEDSEAARPVFRSLRELMELANRESWFQEPLTELSMGMSGDFEAAVEEGATWVRLGTILVGKEEELV